MMQRQAPGLLRRRLLAGGLGAALWPVPTPAQTSETPVLKRRLLQVPRDMGSHPDYAIEWWYLTGYLRSGAAAGIDPDQGVSPAPRPASGEREFGFQLTFFRSRLASTQGMTSAFAAKQLDFAHAAVTDVSGKKLWHDQRIAREGFELARASEHDTLITLRDWSLTREATQYRAVAVGNGFEFKLALRETQALLAQGDQGLSRKGPEEKQASYYYSLPQLRATGSLALQGRAMAVQGTAWLDHEWSQALLHPQAVGWDWIGMNLLDGSALTAFRLRDQTGGTVWDGGSWRHPAMGATPRVFGRGELSFEPVRYWRSPMTQASYPVEWIVRIKGAGAPSAPADLYRVTAVLDNQELDSRGSTGAVYWEGLSELLDSHGRLVGRGYLEMTGYASPLRL